MHHLQIYSVHLYYTQLELFVQYCTYVSYIGQTESCIGIRIKEHIADMKH